MQTYLFNTRAAVANAAANNTAWYAAWRTTWRIAAKAAGKSLAVVLAVGALLASPATAWAQEAGGVEFSQILLTIAIVLGIVSSIYVYALSSKMSGGAVGSALLLYGCGMLCVVISLLSVTWLKDWFGEVAGSIHDLFFIIGFLLMALGSHRVTKIL